MKGLLTCLVVLLAAVPVSAQDHFPLQILWPAPIGAANTGHDADSPIYRAYTGLEWTMQVVANGGDWPYTYELTTNPGAMTIEAGPCTTTGPSCIAGKITWASPSGSHETIVEVCDRDNDCTTATWTVTASTTIGTGGFCFVDGDAAGGGSGSLASPFNTINAARSGCGARSILYFRDAASDYNYSGITAVSGECFASGLRITFVETTHPVMWRGYPGESPVIDVAGGGVTPPCAQFTGDNVWLDGLIFENGDNITVQIVRFNSYGSYIWNTTFRGCGPGSGGFNPACIMYTTMDPGTSYWDYVGGSTFEDIEYAVGEAAVKMYTTQESVIENNYITDVHTFTSEREGLIATKDSVVQFTLRNNRCDSFPDADVPCLGGNYHNTVGATSGEILFNNCTHSDGACYHIGHQSGVDIGNVFVYRNTSVGETWVDNQSATDGDVTFTRNVIVNDGGSVTPAICTTLQLTCTSITDATTILDGGNNLVGVDDGSIASQSDGTLQGSSLTAHGPDSATPKGHMLDEMDAPTSAAVRVRRRIF